MSRKNNNFSRGFAHNKSIISTCLTNLLDCTRLYVRKKFTQISYKSLKVSFSSESLSYDLSPHPLIQMHNNTSNFLGKLSKVWKVSSVLIYWWQYKKITLIKMSGAVINSLTFWGSYFFHSKYLTIHWCWLWNRTIDNHHCILAENRKPLLQNKLIPWTTETVRFN